MITDSILYESFKSSYQYDPHGISSGPASLSNGPVPLMVRTPLSSDHVILPFSGVDSAGVPVLLVRTPLPADHVVLSSLGIDSARVPVRLLARWFRISPAPTPMTNKAASAKTRAFNPAPVTVGDLVLSASTGDMALRCLLSTACRISCVPVCHCSNDINKRSQIPA